LISEHRISSKLDIDHIIPFKLDIDHIIPSKLDIRTKNFIQARYHAIEFHVIYISDHRILSKLDINHIIPVKLDIDYIIPSKLDIRTKNSIETRYRTIEFHPN